MVSNCSGNSLPAAADSEQNPVRARIESRDSGLGKLPGVEAELLRGLAGAREQRGGGATVAERPCTGEVMRGVRVRVWGCESGECGRRGGCEALKEGWAMIAACVPGKVIARITAAISGAALRGERIACNGLCDHGCSGWLF